MNSLKKHDEHSEEFRDQQHIIQLEAVSELYKTKAN